MVGPNIFPKTFFGISTRQKNFLWYILDVQFVHSLKGLIVDQSYNIFFRYPDGAIGFLCGFDTEFGTPIVGFGFDPEFAPKAYGYKLAESIVETIWENKFGGPDLLAMEIIPAFLFEKHFSGKTLEKIGR